MQTYSSREALARALFAAYSSQGDTFDQAWFEDADRITRIVEELAVGAP